MDQFKWLSTIHKVFNLNGKKQKMNKNLLPISLFLLAGKFTGNEIVNILEYGEEFIKELKY